MPRYARILPFALCGLLSAGALADPAGDEEEPVRVYTNADVERLEPIPTSDAPVARQDPERWRYVIEFLAEQHARIDAERAYELDRRLVDDVVERPRAEPPRGWLWAPWLGVHPRVPALHREPPRRHAAAPPFRPGGPRDWITPLHAGPTLADRHRREAIERARRQR